MVVQVVADWLLVGGAYGGVGDAEDLMVVQVVPAGEDGGVGKLRT